MGILIVDPDLTGSRFLSFVLEADGYSDLHTVSTGRDALASRGFSDVSLVITEICLPDMDGATLCEALRNRSYHGPIIVISEQTGVVDRIRSFDAGADDLIAKPIDPSEFLARLAAVTSRYDHDDRRPLGRSLRVGDVELSARDMMICIDEREPVRLTPTELRLIDCLMRNADVAVGRDTLISRTWGFDVFGESNRLDVYIRRLRRKIESDPASPGYLITVRSVGYAFRSHTAPNAGMPDGALLGLDQSDYVLARTISNNQQLDGRVIENLEFAQILDDPGVVELIG